MIQYIVEVLAFQLLFLMVYDLFLKKETFFNWNRIYLIATSLLSLLIPFIQFTAITTAIPEQYTYIFPISGNLQEVVVTGEGASGFNYQFQWEHILFLGMAISLGFLLFKLYKINVLLRKGKVTRLTNYTKVLLLQSKQAFSFFKYIFLGDDFKKSEYEKIIEHELVHVRQKHSIDLLYFEVLRVIFWFNPLIYVYQNRIAELHEFIADAKAVKTNKEDYVNHLLSQAFQVQHISFVNQFLKPSLLKKRLKMISRQQSKSIFKVKYLFLVPLVFGMLVYNSCEQLDESSSYENIAEGFDDDSAMKNRIFNKYDSMGFETIKNLRENDRKLSKTYPSNKLLTKKEFYSSRILHSVYMSKMLDSERLKKLFENTPKNEHISLKFFSGERRLERISYKNYLNDFTFYKVFDKNIRLSLSGFLKVLIDDFDGETNAETILINVENTKDFTGVELTEINRALENHVKGSNNNVLIVTDGKNAARFVNNPDYEQFSNEVNISSSKVVYIKSFAAVEEVPIFPGCENAADKRACFQEKIQAHIRKNFKYPADAQAANIQGRVYTNFVIATDGTIQNLRMRGPDKLLEAEVERIINRLPQFIPGRHKDGVVNVPFSIPITFKLNNSKSSDNSTIKNSEENEKADRFQHKIVPFAVIDEPPVFPGCENSSDQKACFRKKMQEHVVKYFEYPEDLQKEGVEGKVYIMFHISTKGTVESLKVRGPDERLEEAVKKIIDKLPQFKPGRHKGKPVTVSFSIPITYKQH